MDQHVWISDVLADSELIIMFGSDIAEENGAGAIEGLKLLKPGKPVPQDMCPKRLWNEKGRKERPSLPHLSIVNGYPVISAEAADVFRQFDLGEGALYPIEGVYQSDRTTRIPGDYYCWVFGNQKAAFLTEHSAEARPFAEHVPGPKTRWTIPMLLQDDQVAVSTVALEGPDVWVDPLLFKSVFLSGPLGDALDKAGLRNAFRLFRCPMM